MDKIAIVGSPGAGKSTLARQLGDRLNGSKPDVEVIHLDKYYWQKGWKEIPKEDWKEFQRYLVELKQWIIDGTYLSTSAIRLAAADTIIFLDRPRLLCVWRVIWRHFRYRRKPRPDFSDECLDKLDWNYIKKVWSFPELDRPTLLANIQTYSEDKVYFCFHSQREINRFLQSFHVSQSNLIESKPPFSLLSKLASASATLLEALLKGLATLSMNQPFTITPICVAPWEDPIASHRIR